MKKQITCEHCIHWNTQDDICGRCGLSWEMTPGDAWCDEGEDGDDDD